MANFTASKWDCSGFVKILGIMYPTYIQARFAAINVTSSLSSYRFIPVTMSEVEIQFVGFGLATWMAFPDSNLSDPSTVLNSLLTPPLPLVSPQGWSLFRELPDTASAAVSEQDTREASQLTAPSSLR